METEQKMPHNGLLLKNYARYSGKSATELSSEMGYTRSLISRLFNTFSIRTHIWWNLGLVLNRNIFAELAEEFPVKHISRREKEIEAELSDMRKELEIYRRILDKKS